MKRNYVVACLVLAIGLGAEAQQKAKPASGAAPQTAVAQAAIPQTTMSAKKEADIRRLMDLSGAKNLAMQSMDSMETTVRPLVTNSLPPGAYREELVNLFFEKFRSKRDPEMIVKLAVPIYDKHFTDDEIKGLIAFYSTPLGQRALKELPLLLTELREAGGNWGRQLGQDCMKEALAERPDLAQALEAAAKQAKAQ